MWKLIQTIQVIFILLIITASSYAQDPFIFDPEGQLLLSNSNRTTSAGQKFGDLNNDGLMDIVTKDMKIRYQGVDSRFDEFQFIDSEIRDFTLGDFNRDGRTDIVYHKDNKIYTYLQGTDGIRVNRPIIFEPDFISTRSILHALPLTNKNHDADLITLTSGAGDNTLRWYVFDEGSNFWQERSLNLDLPWSSDTHAIDTYDFDDDDDDDLILLTGEKIVILENDDSNLKINNIYDLPELYSKIRVADIEKEGNLDLFANNRGKLSWLQIQSDTLVQKTTFVDKSTNLGDYYLQDMNSDDYLDIVAPLGKLRENESIFQWLEFDETQGAYTIQHPINVRSRLANSILFNYLDIDGDNIKEIITDNYRLNEVNNQEFVFKEYCNFQSKRNHLSIDINNDGWMDLIHYETKAMSSSLNIPGTPYFEEEIELFEGFFNQATFNNFDDLDTMDVNNDGQTDLIFSVFREVYWIFNDNGKLNVPRKLFNIARTFECWPQDLNNDGITDLLLTSPSFCQVGYNNGEGLFDFRILELTQSNDNLKVYFEDVDQDGRTDILMNETEIRRPNLSSWFKNLDTTFSRRILIGEGSENEILAAGDLFDDGQFHMMYQNTDNELKAYRYNEQEQQFDSLANLIDNLRPGLVLYKGLDIDNDGNIEFPFKEDQFNNYTGYLDFANGKLGQEASVAPGDNSSPSGHFTELNNDGFLEILNKNYWHTFKEDEYEDRHPYFLDCFGSANLPFPFDRNRNFIDVDQDGYLDLIFYNGELRYLSNDQQSGLLSKNIKLISESLHETPYFFYTENLNNDDKEDLILVTTDTVYIYGANLNGLGYQLSYKDINRYGIRSMTFFDIDGDNQKDILIYGITRGLLWLKGDNNFNFQYQSDLPNLELFNIHLIDWNNDGRLDLLDYNRDNELVVTLNENGQYLSTTVISTDLINNSSIKTHDINNDGITEILYVGSKGLSWIRPLNGVASSPIPIGGMQTKGNYYIDDFDGDNYEDIITQSGWFRHLDGQGNFGEFQHRDLSDSGYSRIEIVATADLDNNGFAELISTNRIYYNLGDSNIKPFEETLYNNDGIPITASLEGAIFEDINDDKKTDFLYKAFNKICYLQLEDLPNQEKRYTSKRIAIEASNSIGSFIFKDVNQDKYKDIITLSRFQAGSSSKYYFRLEYWKNEPNQDSFKYEGVIQEYELNRPNTIFPTFDINDYDQDGDLDILFYDLAIGELSVFIQANGEFTKEIIQEGISEEYNFAQFEDIDSDGDLDLLLSDYEIPFVDEFVGLLINEGNGDFIFIDQTPEFSLPIKEVKFIDLNQDGYQDIFYGYDRGSNIFVEAHYLVFDPSTSTYVNEIDADYKWLNQHYFFDLNQDSYPDVLINKPTSPPITVQFNDYQNSGALLPASEHPEPPNLGNRTNAFVDVDNDGDIDLIYDDFETIILHENYSANSSIATSSYADLNENGQRDSTEKGLLFVQIDYQPDIDYIFTDSSGSTRVFVDQNDYTVTAAPPEFWELTTDSMSYFVAEDSLDNDKIYEFGFAPSVDTFLIEPSITSAFTRCGFTVPFWLDFNNRGTLTADGGYILTFDTLTSLVSSVPEYDTIIGNNAFWSYENFEPQTQRDIQLEILMPGVDNIGDTLKFRLTSYVLDAVGSTDTLVNYKEDYNSIISCAYDPNDKLVSPNRRAENYTLFGEPLTYTIRFQNTGTDTAFNVEIVDQLDPNLDWSTFRPIAASHSFTTNLTDAGIVYFNFDNILLPDSIVNEPLSHGFVKFKISPLPGLPENTVIENTADIYFDFNPAIVTNTIKNTLVSKLPTLTSLNETLELSQRLSVYPNPFSNQITFALEQEKQTLQTSYQFLLFNAQGKIITTQATNLPFTLNDNYLTAGVYFYQFIDKDGNRFQGSIVRQ